MLKTEITKERWEIAQLNEKNHHIDSSESSYNHYKNIYQIYFNFLNIQTDLENKTIIEIGPAKIASLLFCENYGDSYIVEPLIFEDSLNYYGNKKLTFIRDLYEDCDSPNVDEIWLLNVMQHVQNPDKLIEKAKKHSKVIKFFEPIDTQINDEHPFSYSLSDYQHYFGDSVTVYEPSSVPNFHNARCVYGVYKCN